MYPSIYLHLFIWNLLQSNPYMLFYFQITKLYNKIWGAQCKVIQIEFSIHVWSAPSARQY